MSPNHDFLKENLINFLEFKYEPIEIDVLVYLDMILLEAFVVVNYAVHKSWLKSLRFDEI